MPSQSSIADEWNLWEALLNMGSQSAVDAREFAIEQAVEAFLDGMAEDPAYQADALVEGVVTPIIAARQSSQACSIKAAPGTDIHIGDLVECLDEDWLVVEMYTDKLGILNGTMWTCNDIIRFQNNSSPVITRSCVVDDGSYSKKITDPVVYVPVNTYKVYLPIDTATLKLYIDKRLSFGRIYAPDGSEILEVYKIVGIDLKSKNFGEGSHLMILTMQRDVYNASTDSLELSLCDVFVSPEDTSTPQATGSCQVSGKDEIRIGTERRYTAIFTDENGDVVDGVTAVWEVETPRGIVYEEFGNTVVITVPFDEDYIGSDITISVSDSNSTYGTYEKKVQVITVG